MPTPEPVNAAQPADDLRALLERAALRGVVITPSATLPDEPLPELEEIPGEPLSETVVRMREEA